MLKFINKRMRAAMVEAVAAKKQLADRSINMQ